MLLAAFNLKVITFMTDSAIFTVADFFAHRPTGGTFATTTVGFSLGSRIIIKFTKSAICVLWKIGLRIEHRNVVFVVSALLCCYSFGILDFSIQKKTKTKSVTDKRPYIKNNNGRNTHMHCKI